MPRVSAAAVAKHQLEAFGYAHLSPEFLDPRRSGCTEHQVEEFVGSWNALPQDPYMLSGSGARRRRYGRCAVLEEGIKMLPSVPFVQSDEVNPVFGGIERRFADLDPAFGASPVLTSLIRSLCECIPPLPDPMAYLNLGIHQIRVQTSTTATGLPTPEGIHQDGHRYVAQVFIVRNGIEGGRSTFYENGVPVYQTHLTQPFECLLVDDRRMHHGVSAIQPAGTASGWRDMLLLDFPETVAVEALTGNGGEERAAWSLLPEAAPGG
ncbi:2OG-Fe dioxygenase family protein [Jatrophihabitans sp.]|uniref:2OG-Fe dioxygenase family protein n=1 Tax=Jatrophihabitans sp. TaxID=1932789 RepID=UPI002CB9DA0A|nr:2OG-Fe dioxygenase family protein [Jatrophihabitans sp.]